MLRTILWGTGTNYGKVLCRLLVGVLTFRALFQGLPEAEFGFYQLLWGVIGYAVLMDFGFGFAVQRTVAQADGDGTAAARRSAGEAVSTVFWSFVGFGWGERTGIIDARSMAFRRLSFRIGNESRTSRILPPWCFLLDS